MKWYNWLVAGALVITPGTLSANDILNCHEPKVIGAIINELTQLEQRRVIDIQDITTTWTPDTALNCRLTAVYSQGQKYSGYLSVKLNAAGWPITYWTEKTVFGITSSISSHDTGQELYRLISRPAGVIE